MNSAKQWISVPGVQLALFCVGSLALYFLNLGRTFASDDFEVIGRVAGGHWQSIHDFFRPLSDLSLLMNYAIGGWRPAGYYLFNILVHGINSYLVYRFCLRWGWGIPGSGQREYALLAALFFLAYPFHSEGIDWILGRGASLCTLFGLAALLVALSGLSLRRRLFWAGLFYFVGMAAYEPVILLPFFCLIVLYVHKAGRRELRQWAAVLAGVFVLHIAVRVLFSGVVAGGYGGAVFGKGVRQFTRNIIKVGGRLILPPSDRTGLQIILFAVMLVVLAGVLYAFMRRSPRRSRERLYLGVLILLLAISCVIPVLADVSTRTSESDRLLYFPSVFLCCILAFLVVVLVKRKLWRRGIAAAVLLYMVVFLERTNANWLKGDAITRNILRVGGRGMGDRGVVGPASQPGRIFLINLPDEQEGAFIFRHGFPEAWRMMGGGGVVLGPGPVMGSEAVIGLIVVNHLTRDEALGLSGPVTATWEGDSLRIPPAVTVRRVGRDSVLLRVPGGPEWRAGGQDRVFYWNKEDLVRVLFP